MNAKAWARLRWLFGSDEGPVEESVVFPEIIAARVTAMVIIAVMAEKFALTVDDLAEIKVRCDAALAGAMFEDALPELSGHYRRAAQDIIDTTFRGISIL